MCNVIGATSTSISLLAQQHVVHCASFPNSLQNDYHFSARVAMICRCNFISKPRLGGSKVATEGISWANTRAHPPPHTLRGAGLEELVEIVKAILVLLNVLPDLDAGFPAESRE